MENLSDYSQKLEEFFCGLKNAYHKNEEAYVAKFSRFFESLVFKYKIFREVKKQVDRYLASDFNLVGIMNPDEERISNIIALLLDPEGGHGQGKIFLAKFLEMLSKNFQERLPGKLEDLEKLISCRVRVEREVEAQGRLDIKVRFLANEKPYFVVGIENKPWAGDQMKQLKRYSESLKDEMDNDFVLLFISGDGRLPSEYSISNGERRSLERDGKLLCSGYRSFLLPWLEACYKECESEKVRWFLKDFANWILDNFEVGVSNENG